MDFSVTYNKDTNKAIIKYRQYPFFQNKIAVILVILLLALCIYVIWTSHAFDLKSICYNILTCCILFIPVYLFWNSYVDWRNQKIEESIVFPILDKQLKITARKYPSVRTVKKRKLIKEPKERSQFNPEDETIMVEFSNGDICEYPLKYYDLDDTEEVITKELTLTQNLCRDSRKIDKIKGLFPELSEHGRLILMSSLILIISLVITIPLMVIFASPIGIKLVVEIFMGILIYSVISQWAISKIQTGNKKVEHIKEVISFPTLLPILVIKLMAPTMAILALSIVILGFTVLPFSFLFMFLKNVCNFQISNSTICFVSLVGGTLILVYWPAYIRKVIELIPFVRHTEGKAFKEHLADFTTYIYDSSTVNFIINVIYVVFVCVICLKKYQYAGYVFNKGIDDAIMNAFVVFLAFEGIKNTYKGIKNSTFTFLIKLIRTIID